MKATAMEDNSAARRSCAISWRPPDFEWVKLNVDGSMISETNAITSGGVVRDHMKMWVIGFALNKARVVFSKQSYGVLWRV